MTPLGVRLVQAMATFLASLLAAGCGVLAAWALDTILR